MASPESFITTSYDHQDACLRLCQYTCKLLGGIGLNSRTLLAVSNSMDLSRMLSRVFGLVFAARALRTRQYSSGDNKLECAADVALMFYHPLEIGYWLAAAIPSSSAAARRLFSRLVSAAALMYGVCSGAACLLRLREQQQQQGSGGEGDGSIDDGGLQTLRARLRKLVLDSVLSLNWAIDHPTMQLSDWHIGAIGVLSAWTGLRLQWRAHYAALELKEELEEQQEEVEDVDDD